MAHRIDRALAAIFDFIARAWPFPKTEEQVLRQLEAKYAEREPAAPSGQPQIRG